MLGTAEAEGEPDGSAPQPRLFFQREDGSPLSFYVRPGAAKAELAPLILRHGGRMCRVQEPGAVLLARPGEVPPRASGVFISASYVADCVGRQELLPLETYRLQPPPVTTDTAEGRLPFSEAEDRAILQHLRRSKRGSSGNAVWKEMEEARVTPHSWQAMRDRYLKHLRGKEDLFLPSQRRKLRNSSESAAAVSQSKEVEDVPQPEDQSHTAEGSKGDSESPSSTEDTFSEDMELKTSEEEAPPNPKIRVLESGGDSAGPPSQPPVAEQQPPAPSAVEVATAVEDIKHFMEKFDLDLTTVTQAFLKNSGEVAAVEFCLQMGQSLGGCPLWSRQDDVDLLKGDDDLRSKLVAKYGAENVNRRMAFRKS